jgi:hypothetical protein
MYHVIGRRTARLAQWRGFAAGKEFPGAGMVCANVQVPLRAMRMACASACPCRPAHVLGARAGPMARAFMARHVHSGNAQKPTSQEPTMNDWMDTTTSLPTEREYVRFLVVGHTRCMLGVYENHNFHSRWGAYKDRDVRMWNKVGDAPMTPPPSRTQPDQCYWSERPMREGPGISAD